MFCDDRLTATVATETTQDPLGSKAMGGRARSHPFHHTWFDKGNVFFSENPFFAFYEQGFYLSSMSFGVCSSCGYYVA